MRVVNNAYCKVFLDSIEVVIRIVRYPEYGGKLLNSALS